MQVIRDSNRFLVTEILRGRFPRGRVDTGDAGQGGLDVPSVSPLRDSGQGIFPSSAMIGYFINALNPAMRAFAFLAGILLLIPQELVTGVGWTDILGAVLALIFVVSDYLLTRRRRAAISG